MDIRGHTLICQFWDVYRLVIVLFTLFFFSLFEINMNLVRSFHITSWNLVFVLVLNLVWISHLFFKPTDNAWYEAFLIFYLFYFEFFLCSFNFLVFIVCFVNWLVCILKPLICSWFSVATYLLWSFVVLKIVHQDCIS